MTKINLKKLDISEAFKLIEPGPVVLVSTADKKGRANVMTMSWHMVVEFTPVFACVIGPWDFTYHALRKTKECVLAVPGLDIIKSVVDIGNCSGSDVDKFEKFGLTQIPASKVKAPLVGECIANIECRVADYIPKYSIFILEAVAAWTNPKRKERRTCHHDGSGVFYIDGERLNLRRRMTKWEDSI